MKKCGGCHIVSDECPEASAEPKAVLRLERDGQKPCVLIETSRAEKWIAARSALAMTLFVWEQKRAL